MPWGGLGLCLDGSLGGLVHFAMGAFFRFEVLSRGSVQTVGLEATRRSPGFHDEPLKGEWEGHRSIRLSLSYRAIYAVREDGAVEFALVETVNKHKY